MIHGIQQKSFIEELYCSYLDRWLTLQNLAEIDERSPAADDTVRKWLQKAAPHFHYNQCFQDLCE